MERLEALRAAWAAASTVFVVDSRPEPLSADGLEAEVRAWLTEVFAGDPPPFALPPDLVWWVEEVARTGWSDYPDDPWRTLHSSRGFVTMSERARYVSEPPITRIAWLAIGEWSDRHAWLMCCDPTDARFGQIFDFNDTHPWQFAGARAEGPGKDLLTFLRGFAPDVEE